MKEVDVTSCAVGGVVMEDGKQVVKVILNAVLRKNINFKVLERCDDDRDHDDDHDDCDDRDKDRDDFRGGTIETVESRCGDVRHCAVEIPFCTLVEVRIPKSTKIDLDRARCLLEEAEVVAQVTEVPEDRDDKKKKRKRGFDRIVEKDVVRIVVKVVQLEQLTIPVHKEGCDLDPC